MIAVLRVARMKHALVAFLALIGLEIAVPASAAIVPFPSDFVMQDIHTNGAVIHVRVGGHGPAVVLLHGFADTGDMWAPLAAELERDHTVIVPDLRGLGLSSKPDGGFDKKTQAGDVEGVLTALRVERADLVTHDIGNMVGFAFAAQHPEQVTRWVMMDAPIPGAGPWDEIVKGPLLWQFHFGGPDMERLVKGRERIYLDRFWNDFAAHPNRITEDVREHYERLYALPGAMHSSFAQFNSFDQDAIDNRALLANGPILTMPILAIGGEKTFGEEMAVVARAVGTNVQGVVIADSGHWLMDEQPAATMAAIRTFLDKPI